MSLPFATQATLLHFLKLALSIKAPDITLSTRLEKEIALLPQKLYDGTLDELSFEYLIKDLVDELNEPMFIWRMVEQIRFSQLIAQGPVLPYLLSSPDAKTCFLDFVKLKHLLFPPSYSFKVYETEEQFIFEVTEKDHKSPVLYIKEDVAICYLLLILKDFIGNSFDYLKIMVPQSRTGIDAEIIKKVSKTEIITHNGPAQAIFLKSQLDYKNNFFNEGIRQRYSSQVTELLVEQKSSVLLTQKIIKILKKQEQPGSFSIDKMAEQLNKSTSTLRRNLSTEKNTYKQLQDQVVDELCFTTLLSYDYKIDALALKLGYSERSSFERAFRNKFGCSPSKFRAFGKSIRINSDNKQRDGNELKRLMDSISPLSTTCNELMMQAESQTLELNKVVEIIQRDPVFTAHIMGRSNRAIYGRAPKNLHEAIGHKLGIKKVISLAILFSSKGCLSEHLHGININKFFSMMTIAPELFQMLKKNSKIEAEKIPVNITYPLTLSLLGILLLLHTRHIYHAQIAKLFNVSSGLNNLILNLENKFNVSLFGSSLVLLAYWGVDKEILKDLSNLEKKSQKISANTSVESLLLLTLDICLTNTLDLENNDHIKIQLEKFEISNYDEITSLFFDGISV
ncbi:MAG: helix-turn-helix domain-containing protein [gamma proteobacterium symbiont of Bathyaustriella thionipta]|nr:helix-turn-helix domain-containing protein [gamma proteobacterium symbiont of Bathyaustriella thionipta]MCU7958206.1 helix-turn-helix domain-containing protein [gamma proteobacterium symbiont of Bathyaustriella thionipta]MCU7966950.1 helix-turn-helix domain-containing protein [gamma proteobacterium symbiont of Bathyaustriella thionipta]